MSKKNGLDYWTTYLAQTELPSLSSIISELNELFLAEGSSAAELAELILRDATLTSRVLRLANSVNFNPKIKNPIVTVTQAVVLLGFSGVKSILLTTMLIEHVLSRGDKSRMLRRLACSLHAATQAKFLLVHVLDEDEDRLEEIFIAALIYHIGELAFWSSNNPTSSDLDKRMTGIASADKPLIKEILGTNFKLITQRLVSKWHLGPTFNEVFSSTGQSGKLSQVVVLANEIAESTEAGWGNPAVDKVVQKVSKLIKMSSEDTLVLLKDRSKRASILATSYGASEVSNLIPSAEDDIGLDSRSLKEAKTGDAELQLQIVHELNSMARDKFEISTFFHLLLEGVHRGIGMERTGVFLIEQGGEKATLKFSNASNGKYWEKGLKVTLNNTNAFYQCIEDKKPVWFKDDKITKSGDSIYLENNDTLIACICAGVKPIALIVTDRGYHKSPITKFQFNNFCHFSQQATQALSSLVGVKK